jgi:phenylpyruvate tautomerase PptA (4-oxalocrotonate tautomerase family)
MKKLTVKTAKQAGVKALKVTKSILRIWLDDGREIGVLIQEVPDLNWLVKGKPKQRAHWVLERGGAVIFWPDLKGRVEVSRLLDPRPFA